MNNAAASAIGTPARWGGCATVNPDDPRLWAVPATDDSGGDVHGFSLAEVIEAGLRQKIVGLADADKEAVIADCVADTLDALRHV